MSYDTYDAEPYAVHVTKVRRARVEHRCSACHRRIAPGHHYMDVRTVFDGRFDRIKRCGACERTHEHLRELGETADTYPDERLNCGLEYEYEWCSPPPPEIARLPMLTDDEAGALLAPGREEP